MGFVRHLGAQVYPVAREERRIRGAGEYSAYSCIVSGPVSVVGLKPLVIEQYPFGDRVSLDTEDVVQLHIDGATVQSDLFLRENRSMESALLRGGAVVVFADRDERKVKSIGLFSRERYSEFISMWGFEEESL